MHSATVMIWLIIAMLPLASCNRKPQMALNQETPSNEQQLARKELEQRGIAYSEAIFLESADKGRIVYNRRNGHRHTK
jgi:hypothetical protein